MTAETNTADHDVVIVGGGPAGCAAAVFTARYGLETLVFDRGRAALPRCAFLENYLGFPAGIDIESFYDLIHAHVDTAGGELVSETVVAVDRTDGGVFLVETQDGRTTSANAVIAAAWYDGDFLRPLGDGEMFEHHDHGDESHERLDPSYTDEDGRTPIDGLYVASPAGPRSAQALTVAGHGAHVARSLLEDHRREREYPDGVSTHYDWMRRDAEFSGDWGERDRWREWFDAEIADDHTVSPARLETIRERYIDRAFEARLSEDVADQRARRGLRQLLETFGTDRVLAALPDDEIEEYIAATDSIDASRR